MTTTTQQPPGLGPGLPVWSLSAEEVEAEIARMEVLARQIGARRSRLLRQAQTLEVAGRTGATSTANWYAVQHTLTRREAHAAMRLAKALDARPVTEDALAAGRICTEQARVICDAVAAVAKVDGIDTEIVAQAETHLLGLAAEHDAKELRGLGRHILDVLAPEISEAHEQKLLEDEEERARQKCRLTMGSDGHGSVHGRFTLPDAQAAMFAEQLRAFAAPKHRQATGRDYEPDRVSAERLGAAFCEWIENYPTEHLPNAGGTSVRIVVTMSLADLVTGTGVGTLADGTPISAGQARRLACEAGIVPVVLGGKSEPLDVGRTKRFHTPAQRTALAVRDGGCAAEGCDAPPGLCHAHHDPSWASGGKTNVNDAYLLCARHHHMIHDSTYETTRLSHGKVRFTRRT